MRSSTWVYCLSVPQSVTETTSLLLFLGRMPIKIVRSNNIMEQVRETGQECRHSKEVSCLQNSLQMGLRSLKYGVAIRLIINIVKFLIGLGKKKGPSLLTFLLNQVQWNNLRLPLSCFFCTLVMRLVYCQVRKLRGKEDRVTSLAAGAAAGVATMLLLPEQNWHFTLMVISTRVFDGLYKQLIRQGLFVERALNYYVIFMLSSLVVSYGYFFEPDILDPEAFNVYDRMSVLDPNEKVWMISVLNYRYSELKRKGYLFFNDKFSQLIKARAPK